MPEDQQKDDDRDRNADKPKQNSLAHIHLLTVVAKVQTIIFWRGSTSCSNRLHARRRARRRGTLIALGKFSSDAIGAGSKE
ncbi:hypothetical protein F9288_09355 [Sphingomonas sp. CL5.1]|uniref:hypothetical protein n=1 Tax=Sphingomonas sp. CL5.1 TaxID=2653203 RepID=UPI00158444AA|nr:hypothetical protein [Sphingomonas sp. CL5.1]QKR98211.1 hypothetical protein F9288_09355 [Sphingomonas sp. CL5.1]